jgi:Flp pilus assembly protein TadG
MMRKLDKRGAAALEFCLVGGAFFALVFAIFDFGRYAITVHSLNALANAGARAMMIACYTPAVAGTIANTTPSGCTGSYLSDSQMQTIAPFLYLGGLAPSLSIQVQGSALSVTASQPGFTMLMPIWGTALNAPSASTNVPF